MKKRIFAGIMIMVLAFASVVGVSAAPSRTDEIYVSGDSDKIYEVTPNAGKTEDDLKKDASDSVKNEIKDKTLIWQIFDLEEIGTPVKNSNGKYEVELTVTTMTKNQKDFVVVYYDDAAGEWKTATPKVDYDKKTLTFEFDSLSAIGVYAAKVSGGSQGTSPSTEGTSSAWMLWMAVAIVVLGAGVVATQKKSR